MWFRRKQNKNLIVCLGNPGNKYTLTRHNAGFIFLDYFLEHIRKTYGEDSVSTTKSNDKLELFDIPPISTFALKPLTYMNKSGSAAATVTSFYKIPKEKITLVYDDLDMPLGNYKYSKKAPKVHNGVNSVTSTIGKQGLSHLRIGIDNRQRKDIAGDVYVLSRFTDTELQLLKRTLDDAVKQMLQLLK
jgi:PTH1 family peptidyl-tRNA hydrolase